MTAKSEPDAKKPAGSRREQGQPYATENENYRFDVVKPPTHPDQREDAKGSGRKEETVEHPRGDGASNDKVRKP